MQIQGFLKVIGSNSNFQYVYMHVFFRTYTVKNLFPFLFLGSFSSMVVLLIELLSLGFKQDHFFPPGI